MKTVLLCPVVALLLSACSSTGHVTRTGSGTTVYGLDDEPQTTVAGEGSLMPGAYESRALETGQFTGRERTSDQIGQRPALPPEADARELARDDSTGIGTGAGTLGQTGIVPGKPVTGETLMQESVPPGTPAHVAVSPPGSESEPQEEAIGAPPPRETGRQSSPPPEH